MPVQPESRKVGWRIAVFFLVSYALTWFGNLGNWIAPSDLWPRPMMPFGPLLAAPLVIATTEGRDGLRAWWRRIIILRAPARVWLAGTVVPALIILASVLLAVLAGAHVPTAAELGTWPELLAFPIISLFGPIPEEPSFRGYGQHALQQRMSTLVAALWIGLGVLIWHVPVFVTGEVQWPIAIALPAVSVVYAWLYRAGGSVWPLVALHAVQNNLGGHYFSRMFAGDEGVLWLAFLAAFYVAWAVALVARYGVELRPAWAVGETARTGLEPGVAAR